MPPVSDAVLEKLKKILARADTRRGATEAEVRTAMEMAQRLAVQHNIDLATVSIDADTKKQLEVDANQVHISTKYERPYHGEILTVLRECFGVRTIMNSYWTDQAQRVIERITFVGEKTDIQLATYCWDWLQTLFPKCWSEFRKAHGMRESWTNSRSYFRGLRAGLCEANRRVVEDLSTSDRERYALVLVDKEAAVAARVEELFPDARTLRTHTKKANPYALRGGYEKGKTIRLNGGLQGGADRATIN